MNDVVPAYRRVRLVALWLFLQTVVILVILGALFGQLVEFVLLGAVVGAATAGTMLGAWAFRRQDMERQGFRW